MHGKTMDQIIQGAAGMIIVTDSVESALALPRTYGVDDIPLIMQFQTFDSMGMLMPDDMMDNEVLVNGDIMPMATLPAQVVRLRLLNASSHRTFRIGMPAVGTFQMIASDNGLLDAPLSMSRLNIGPGERAEVLLDLGGMEGMNFNVRTYGSELPQGVMGGPPPAGEMPGPLDSTDFAIMSVMVGPATSDPVTTIPTALTTNMPWSEASATQTFNLQLQEIPMGGDSWFLNGLKFDMERIDFTTQVNNVVIWEFENMTMMNHPMHIHGGPFFVLDVDGATPPMELRGPKDVVNVEPMGMVRVIMKYEHFSDPVIPYMVHCHILSHSDDGMMLQFLVDPATGMEIIAQAGGLNVFPNPSNGNVTITSTAGPFTGLRVLDATGREVRNVRPNSSPSTLAITGIAPGVYTLLADLKGSRRSVRVVME